MKNKLRIGGIYLMGNGEPGQSYGIKVLGFSETGKFCKHQILEFGSESNWANTKQLEVYERETKNGK